MAVFVPPGFYDFIMSLNDEDAEKVMAVRQIMNGSSPTTSRRTRVSIPTMNMPKKKQTRKVSRYQKVFGKHLKALKKKHPRSKISVLMKKAHTLTKREMKK
jgi:hypothetical protein